MTGRCPAQYPGRRRGDRCIDCHLPAGHPGEHEEADTEITWASEPTPDVPNTSGRQVNRRSRYLAVTIVAAVICVTSRLVADALFPPHLRWWLTPAVALVSSAGTSLLWFVEVRRVGRG